MIQKRIYQILIAPISLLYGLGVSCRNWLYESGFFKSFEFSIPVISVGNISMGGEGKTPHIEYLVRILQAYLKIGILSRGYNRKSKGFKFVDSNSTAVEMGDEPVQFKRKFPSCVVSVSESRAIGIPQMIKSYPSLQVMLLDDAFQHRSVKPGLNIILTSFQQPFFNDFLLPSGRLREWRSSSKRADIIIVSKCPLDITTTQKTEFKRRLNLQPKQQLFFTRYSYGLPYFFFENTRKRALEVDLDIILICGIANSQYLIDYLEPRVQNIRILEFEDHHYFSSYDMGRLADAYQKFNSTNKLILTTEKDATRLEEHSKFLLEKQLPIYIVPIFVNFLEDEDTFAHLIRSYLLQFKV